MGYEVKNAYQYSPLALKNTHCCASLFTKYDNLFRTTRTFMMPSLFFPHIRLSEASGRDGEVVIDGLFRLSLI